MDSATVSEATARRPTARQVLRVLAPAAFFVALVAACVVRGIPTSRDALFLWLTLGLVAFTATGPRGRLRDLLVDWLPLAAVLFVYDLLRGYADEFQSALRVAAAALRRVGVLRHRPHGLAAAAPVGRDGRLVRLRQLGRLPHALRRDAHGRGLPVAVPAGAVPAVRGDGRAPGGDGLRDLRRVPGRPAVDGQRRGPPRPGRPRRAVRLGGRARRLLRLGLGVGLALRERRRRDAVAPRRLRTPDRACSSGRS